MKHIVGFSGGIDSQACARWVLNRSPAEDVILMNSDAGSNEDPLTMDFVRWYSATVHPVVTAQAVVSDLWQTPGAAEARGLDPTEVLDFPRLIELKGPPLRTRRTCTQFLKNAPQRRWMAEAFGVGGPYEGQEYERYTGVRRNESDKRKDTPAREWDGYYDCWLNHPIMDWTKEMCFAYVKASGERVNELYTLGFDRVGCAPCILSGKDDLLNWATRRPEMIEKIAAWEARTGFTFMQSKVPGLREASIRDMVEWARTSRGGRQKNLLRMLDDRPTCESKYGLCE